MSIEQRINFGENLNSFTAQKIEKAMTLAGKTLPVSIVERNGHMITVKFELIDIPFTLPSVTVPLFGPQYIRYPLQPGERGIVFPADAYLGGVSGLGGGTANLMQPFNLSALVFLPISHTEWQDVDYQTLTMYGPEGVILRDINSKCTFILTPDSVAIQAPKRFEAKVGATSIVLTPGAWAINGESGTLQDSAGTTSPQAIQAAWEAMTTWANTHTHYVTAEKTDTKTPNQKLDAEIVE